MVAVDTNVVVRFLVRDDEVQALAVYERLKRAQAEREVLLIPLLVVLETIWVLGSAYGKSRAEVLDAIDELRRMPVFQFENDPVVARFLVESRSVKADLGDILIAHSAMVADCDAVLTFDRGAAKLSAFRLLA